MEHKGRDQKATKVANELIGMLNAGGGTLVYGMADDGTVEELQDDFDPEDLDATICEEYRKAMSYTGSFEQLAVKRNLARRKEGQLIYKNSAILLFAEDPSQYINNAAVRYVRYRGTELKSGTYGIPTVGIKE